MAGILKFKAADVKRVLLHALQATDWTPECLSYGEEPDWKATYAAAKPAVILVHDDGVYLMSAGIPRDPRDDEAKAKHAAGDPVWHSFVAYAEGCHPLKDEDCWEMARQLVGGDDFGEHLSDPDWLKRMGESALKGRDVRLRFSSSSIKLL